MGINDKHIFLCMRERKRVITRITHIEYVYYSELFEGSDSHSIQTNLSQKGNYIGSWMWPQGQGNGIPGFLQRGSPVCTRGESGVFLEEGVCVWVGVGLSSQGQGPLYHLKNSVL